MQFILLLLALVATLFTTSAADQGSQLSDIISNGSESTLGEHKIEWDFGNAVEVPPNSNDSDLEDTIDDSTADGTLGEQKIGRDAGDAAGVPPNLDFDDLNDITENGISDGTVGQQKIGWEAGDAAGLPPFAPHLDTRSMTKREPSAEWEQLLVEGNWFRCLLYAPVNTVAQSTYTSFDQLETYGWALLFDSPVDIAGLQIPMNNIYTLLGLPIDDESNTQFAMGQNDDVTVNGKAYKATGGFYQNTITKGRTRADGTVGKGAIIAEMNNGPDAASKFATNGPITPDEIVPLKQWSDVIFLMWQHCQTQSAQPAQNLGYVNRMHIITAKTVRMITEAMDGQAVTDWPGKTFSMASDQGKVLLATPHGAAVAWLLLQHKVQLGHKVVDRVTVFGNARGAYASLCFYLRDWQSGMVAP